MKKRIFLFVLLIILNIYLVYGQACDPLDKNCGVNLCNIRAECGLKINGEDDGICPEDFFDVGKICYIKDNDCCDIKEIDGKKIADWSLSPNNYEPITGEVAEGSSVYMYVETNHCEGKDANFNIFLVENNLIFGDTELLSSTAGPYKITGEKVSARLTAYTDPAAIEDGISKFKFRVKINPDGESSLLSVSSTGTVITNVCNDLIDNDADGCADETTDCADGNEDNQDFNECPACQGLTPPEDCNTKCSGWRCNMGDCLEGKKSVSCPSIPSGCPLAMPPKFVKCYEKTVPFPFYDNFNLLLSVFSLFFYYSFNIIKKKF